MDPIKLDRERRVAGPRNAPPTHILCRVFFFSLKEEDIKRAWCLDPVEFYSVHVTLLPDLFRATLSMHQAVKPLFNLIQEHEALYWWEHSFYVVICKNGEDFRLYTLDQFPALFTFLGTEHIELLDWINLPEDNMIWPWPSGLSQRRSHSRSCRS